MSKGYWIKTENGGVYHILAKSEMSDEELKAMGEMMDAAAKETAKINHAFNQLWSDHTGDEDQARYWFIAGYQLAQQRAEEQKSK